MRVKGGFATRRRHKRMLDRAEGFQGRRSTCFKLAKRAVQTALKHAFKNRRMQKREFRALWITRINAACRPSGIKYSALIHGLQKANIIIDRKVLADLACSDAAAFGAIVEKAKAALAAK
jgi:large subunit ribosomal protein L20